MNINLFDKYAICTDIAEEQIEISPKEVIPYLNFSLTLLDHLDCIFHKNIVYNLLSIAYHKLGNSTKRDFWSEKTKDLQACALEKRPEIEFYNSAMPRWYSIEDSANPIEVMEDLLYERSLAQSILKDAPNHLLDYYVANALEIFNSFKGQRIEKSKWINKILSLMESTKVQEQYIKKNRDSKREIQKGNIKKLALLKDINEFKDTTNYGNIVYHEIFKIIAEEYNPDASIKAYDSNFKPNHLISEVEKGNIQVLEFIAYNNKYLGYSYAKQGMHLFEVKYDSLVLTMDSLTSGLLNQSEITPALVQLKNILLAGETFDTKVPLVIIPDGLLNFTPWHLLFPPDQILNLRPALANILNQEHFSIANQQANFFSYSDPQTLASDAPLKIKELKYGYEESKNISQVIKLRLNNLYAGKDFTVDHLNNAMDGGLLHISSHASSNLNNKLDNYLIIRDEKGDPKKIFAYEIEALNTAPLVTILSACDTGIGAFINGSSAYSLSKAFIQNGSQAVIKSLWKVNDRSSKDFMTKIYEYWQSGDSLGAALQKSRTFFHNKTSSHPYFWAGFALEGNPNIYLN